ncbi:MAG: hypothetical protein J5711_01110 [Bacteroidales bacterium]|nr:hypothetical protein [Bacteroidales bacterium]
MKFSYDDFRENYLHSDALMPLSPLKPLEIIDMGKYDKALDDWGIERRIRKTFDELERRLGSKYFSEFERVQTKVKEYGSFMFPLYKILFLDIACEDWLSLVDFHKGFSRDHSVHQPLTAYIVCKLLGGGDIAESFQIQDASLLDKALDVIIDGQGTKYLRDRLAFYDSSSKLLSGDRNAWKAVFYQTAIITAMYHDLGYPWQFIDRMHDFLKDDILLCGRLPKGSSAIHSYITAHNEELMFRPFYNYGESGASTDDIKEDLFEHILHNSHGLPGALAYHAYNNEYCSKTPTDSFGLIKFCQEWSCLAILMHDMQKAHATKDSSFPRLDFNTDPLSYIIALADTLEDFNRPSASIDKTETGCEIKYTFPSLSVELRCMYSRTYLRIRR